jgi:hypothetical protein
MNECNHATSVWVIKADKNTEGPGDHLTRKVGKVSLRQVG